MSIARARADRFACDAREKSPIVTRGPIGGVSTLPLVEGQGESWSLTRRSLEAATLTLSPMRSSNDAHREFWTADAIRRWVAEEIVGDKVTVDVTEVFEHYSETIVRGRYDGEYDKTSLPDELILTSEPPAGDTRSCGSAPGRGLTESREGVQIAHQRVPADVRGCALRRL